MRAAAHPHARATTAAMLSRAADWVGTVTATRRVADAIRATATVTRTLRWRRRPGVAEVTRVVRGEELAMSAAYGYGSPRRTRHARSSSSDAATSKAPDTPPTRACNARCRA